MLELFALPTGLFMNGGSSAAGLTPFLMKGVNWFGFETGTFSPHGLWSSSMDYLLDFLKKERFNAIRLPFSVETIEKMDSYDPTAIDYNKNPDLRGKKIGQVMDTLVKKCKKRGILVMPDMHRFEGNGAIPPLWYDTKYSEARVIAAWKRLVRRYKDEPTVFAADLKNEPHDNANWGSGNKKDDWAAAAERIGNEILRENPKLLIFVEGVSKCTLPPQRNSWWGGCLDGVTKRPVRLIVKNKVVYSPHVYGPDVYDMSIFKSGSGFPKNLPAIWDADWAHIHKRGIGTVVIGEWGGQNREGSKDRVWQTAFVDYLRKNGMTCRSFYWSLNPNSGDTKGLLDDDWHTGVRHRLDMATRACPTPTDLTAVQQLPLPSSVWHAPPTNFNPPAPKKYPTGNGKGNRPGNRPGNNNKDNINPINTVIKTVRTVIRDGINIVDHNIHLPDGILP